MGAHQLHAKADAKKRLAQVLENRIQPLFLKVGHCAGGFTHPWEYDLPEIGRASCRDRVFRAVFSSVGRVSYAYLALNVHPVSPFIQ